jgi:hypothetical protein
MLLWLKHIDLKGAYLQEESTGLTPRKCQPFGVYKAVSLRPLHPQVAV